MVHNFCLFDVSFVRRLELPEGHSESRAREREVEARGELLPMAAMA